MLILSNSKSIINTSIVLMAATGMSNCPIQSSPSQTNTTHGQCSPIVIAGTSAVASIKIDCTNSLSKKEIAKRNLSEMITSLRRLMHTQNLYFMPSLDDYARDPSPLHWEIVVSDLDRTQNALNAAIDTTIRYLDDPKLDITETTHLLRQRNSALIELKQLHEKAKSESGAAKIETSVFSRRQSPQDKFTGWVLNYRELLNRLRKELSVIETKMDQLDKN